MDRYKNLLVAIDPDHEDQPALARAIDIAKKSSTAVKLTLFLSTYDFSYEVTSMLSPEDKETMHTGVIRQREEWINALLTQYDINDIEITVHVEWHKRPYECMIARVFEAGHDLLIKATHEHAKLGSVIFTPTDWHLLRKCPCPVLLVKGNGWPMNGKILTAVSLASESETHTLLDDKLVNEAQAMSHFFNAEVNLVNAYPATPVNITIELPEFDPATYTDAVRGHHLLEMKALRQKHGIDEPHTFCFEGLPEDIIPSVAKNISAEMVILGTTGRTGFSAIFIGNTAEHTIDQLNCDVLAIKPDGYVSPLSPDLK